MGSGQGTLASGSLAKAYQSKVCCFFFLKATCWIMFNWSWVVHCRYCLWEDFKGCVLVVIHMSTGHHIAMQEFHLQRIFFFWRRSTTLQNHPHVFNPSQDTFGISVDYTVSRFGGFRILSNTQTLHDGRRYSHFSVWERNYRTGREDDFRPEVIQWLCWPWTSLEPRFRRSLGSRLALDTTDPNTTVLPDWMINYRTRLLPK